MVGFDTGAFRLYVEKGAPHGASASSFSRARCASGQASASLRTVARWWRKTLRFRADICETLTVWCSISRPK